MQCDWRNEMKIETAIAKAERLLPGTAAPEGKRDPRWHAVIAVADHIAKRPLEVWRFARKWGAHSNRDVRAAIASCVLEHLLEHHFATVFPLVKRACQQSRRFADTFRACWQFGQAELPGNSQQFMQLKTTLANTASASWQRATNTQRGLPTANRGVRVVER